MDKITDMKKLMELSSFFAFPISMMAYVNSVGLGGFMLRDEGLPMLITYPWAAFEGLIVTMLFMQAVFFIGTFFKEIHFPAVIGAILVSYGLFVFIPDAQLPMQGSENALWMYASLIMGIVLMKSAYDEKET